MYTYIQKLKPHFISLREIPESVISLDIKIPERWKYTSVSETYTDVGFLEQQRTEKTLILSIMTENNQEGYEKVFECGIKIIELNKEMEEKEQLLKQKIEELKKLFDVESLEKLKQFDILKHGQEDSTRDENSTGIKLVE